MGLPENLPVNEACLDKPITIYDTHKCMAENYLKYYSRMGFVRGTTLRLTNVYGPGPKSSSKERGMLPIDSGFAGRMIRVNATDAKPDMGQISDRGSILRGRGTEMKSLIDAGSITAKDLEDEIRTWYKDHMDSDVVDKIVQASKQNKPQ